MTAGLRWTLGIVGGMAVCCCAAQLVVATGFAGVFAADPDAPAKNRLGWCATDAWLASAVAYPVLTAAFIVCSKAVVGCPKLLEGTVYHLVIGLLLAMTVEAAILLPVVASLAVL